MIKKIAVLGAGTMGHGIAEAFAMYGYDVNLFETDEKRRATVKQEIEQELGLLAEEDFIRADAIPTILTHIKLFSDLKLCG